MRFLAVPVWTRATEFLMLGNLDAESAKDSPLFFAKRTVFVGPSTRLATDSLQTLLVRLLERQTQVVNSQFGSGNG